MELKMFIGEQLIDASPILPGKLSAPGYIQDLKSRMEEKNEILIVNSPEEPVFYLDAVPSRYQSTDRKQNPPPSYWN